jgi:hypothetical protein
VQIGLIPGGVGNRNEALSDADNERVLREGGASPLKRVAAPRVNGLNGLHIPSKGLEDLAAHRSGWFMATMEDIPVVRLDAAFVRGFAHGIIVVLRGFESHLGAFFKL